MSQLIDLLLHADRYLLDIVTTYGPWIYALLFGGATLHYFAAALTIGILFSIYSSVLVACPLAMYLGASREDFVKPEKKVAAAQMP